MPFQIKNADPLLFNIFHNAHILNGGLLPSGYDIRTSELIHEIWNCKLTGLPRINFLGSKALEIVSCTLHTYQQDISTNKKKGLSEIEFQAVATIAETINANLTEKKTTKDFARQVAMNEYQLQRCFQKVYGKTINTYIQDVRLAKALKLLQTKNINISEIVAEVGLSSHSYFSEKFKAKFGITPRAYLKSLT